MTKALKKIKKTYWKLTWKYKNKSSFKILITSNNAKIRLHSTDGACCLYQSRGTFRKPVIIIFALVFGAGTEMSHSTFNAFNESYYKHVTNEI